MSLCRQVESNFSLLFWFQFHCMTHFLIFDTIVGKIFSHKCWICLPSLTQCCASLEILENKSTFASLLFLEPEMTWDLAQAKFEWVLKGGDVTALIFLGNLIRSYTGYFSHKFMVRDFYVHEESSFFQLWDSGVVLYLLALSSNFILPIKHSWTKSFLIMNICTFI